MCSTTLCALESTCTTSFGLAVQLLPSPFRKVVGVVILLRTVFNHCYDFWYAAPRPPAAELLAVGDPASSKTPVMPVMADDVVEGACERGHGLFMKDKRPVRFLARVNTAVTTTTTATTTAPATLPAMMAVLLLLSSPDRCWRK